MSDGPVSTSRSPSGWCPSYRFIFLLYMRSWRSETAEASISKRMISNRYDSADLNPSCRRGKRSNSAGRQNPLAGRARTAWDGTHGQGSPTRARVCISLFSLAVDLITFYHMDVNACFGKNQCLQPLEATRDRRAASCTWGWEVGSRVSDAQKPDSAWDFKIETIAANRKWNGQKCQVKA